MSVPPIEPLVLKPEARAIAALDAICDEYEAALRSDQNAHQVDRDSHLAPWLDRAARDQRPWLRAELCLIRDELGFADESPADRQPVVPEGVSSEAWSAVTNCSTFEILSSELQASLARRLEPREFGSGTALLRSGETASGLYLLTAGRVQVMGGEGASRYEIDTDDAGGVLGEMSIITGYPCSADVVATSIVRAFVLPLDAFRTLCGESPELEIALTHLISDRLGQNPQDALCGKSLGGFRLQRCIGRGAMGVVYAAEHEPAGTLRALKMLRHRFVFSPKVIARFDQETDLLSKLEHPNIVSLRGHFIAYRTRFIVLDFYNGSDLSRVVRQQGPIDEPTVRAVLGQIAAGLLYAHQQGVLHLDLKPANILIDREGRIAITDFGLSRLIESGGGDQELVGTPPYMPPEQFMMTNIGPHCDWYAFACIGYELLSGTRLFSGQDSSAFLDAKFRAPTTHWPATSMSDELRSHLHRALDPMADDRSLDLAEVATWARPVPELANAVDQTPTTVNG